MTTVSEFTDEMNKHANTSYRAVNNKYVVEFSHGVMSRTDRISVWRHERDGEADESNGEEGYPHPWVLVARTWGERGSLASTYLNLTTEQAILDLRDSDRNANRDDPFKGQGDE